MSTITSRTDSNNAGRDRAKVCAPGTAGTSASHIPSSRVATTS